MMKVIPTVQIRKFIFQFSLFWPFLFLNNVAKVGLLQFICVISSSSVHLSLFYMFFIGFFQKNPLYEPLRKPSSVLIISLNFLSLNSVPVLFKCCAFPSLRVVVIPKPGNHSWQYCIARLRCLRRFA